MHTLNNIILRFFSLFLVVFLASCACPPQEPVIKVVTQTVEIPIPVACKQEMPEVPDFCFDKLTEEADVFDKVKCLLSDRKLSLSYETTLAARLKACK